MSFKLSEKSLQRLTGVHPDLQAVVKRAIEITPVDFLVVEGLRTKERQAYLLDAGKSRTLNSYHLTGHAVDIAPIVDGKPSWDWKYFFPMANAMRIAAKELNVRVKWGACWKYFDQIPSILDESILSKELADGPHFQIDRSQK